MNILMSFLYSPPTTACYYAKAFRQLGHDVRTWGPSRDLSRYREDQRYRLTGPHNSVPYKEIKKRLMTTLDRWQPDLFIYIEAGDGWWPGPLISSDIPSVAYFIDSHSRLQEHLERAPYFDHVFYAHKQFGDDFGPDAHWLPVACDPDVHTPTCVPNEPEYDIAFVGNVYPDVALYEPRREALRMLAGRYNCNFVSGVYFEDMANVYANARIVFNHSARGDLNMRVFEAMCSGTPLVTDPAPGGGLEELFGREPDVMPLCFAYTDEESLLRCIREITQWTGLGQEMGQLARAEVLAEHTYVHRAQQMLAEVGL